MSVDIPAPHVPGSSAVAQPSIPSTSTTAPPTEVPGAPVLGGETLPKPVTPAEAIAAEPAKALDPIAEPSILDKAQALAKPYLDKVEPYVHKAQEATKPYTDKLEAKAQELMDKIEISHISVRPLGASPKLGNAPTTTAAPTSDNTAERTLDNASITASDASEKAKGIFEQGLSAVQSTFTQITHTIEEKTASPTHPGIITQVTNAAHKVGERIEKAINDVDNNTTPSAHPVQTTTNTVPHIPLFLFNLFK